MYALRLATCCLLYVSIAFGRSPSGSGKGVVVYLRDGAGPSPAVLAAAKSELVSLMQGMGVRVEWWNPRNPRQVISENVATPSLIVADFQGVCAPPSINDQVASRGSLPPLAETSITDGQILPFAHVNCDALARLLGSSLADQMEVRRDFVYGRAIARLLAHEMYHIVAQTRNHEATGIAKEHFSRNDLLSEHFEFQPPAIANAQPLGNRVTPTAAAITD